MSNHTENSYEINLITMQIRTPQSNGWQPIMDVYFRNGHHVQYVNNDKRIWSQQVHVSHFLFVESQLRIERINAQRNAPVTAADVSMAVAI